ncbi:hypothetical protein [Catenulispora pinisilvae]|uniref:hypothetical protein n=1 Tax=Catenulispora pinisilvae TaxID=2705253 RepID=UPI001891A9EE|nr:hypothetical protein [Catenulispora pinisilvae]
MSSTTTRRFRVRTALGVTLAAGLAVATATAAMAGGSGKAGKAAGGAAGALAGAVSGGGAVAGAVGKAAAGVTVGTGQSRVLSPSYFGVAFDYGGGSIYPNPGTAGYPAAADSQLAALSPATVRWPAGTSANYWDWTKGQPVGDPYMTPNPTPDFHSYLSDLEKAYAQTHVPPVFVLNVMTSTLADQEAMLVQAKADGLPIDNVELGNELDLCFNSDYQKYFPNGTDYGSKVVGPWSYALHNLYPDLKIAAVAGFEDSTSKCVTDRTWNADVQTGIKTAIAAGDGREPDAYIMHVHPTYPNALTTDNVGDFLAGPDTWPGKVQAAATASKFGTTPVWLTEISFSLSDAFADPPQDTYGVALYNSSLLMQMAGSATATDMAEFWSSFGSENSYAYTASPTKNLPLALTPDGLAMQWLAQAGNKATSATPLTFNDEPTIGANAAPGLVGVKFTGAGGTHEVLVNLSGTSVTVPVGGAVPAGSYQQVSGDPTAAVRTASSLNPGTVSASGTLTLPAYSISKM